jgi:tryptophan halogenase
MPIPDTLRYRMELFKASGRVAFQDRELFVEPNWLSIFIGQHIEPRRHDPLADLPLLEDAKRQLVRLRTLIRSTAEAMPTHAEFIGRHCHAS